MTQAIAALLAILEMAALILLHDQQYFARLTAFSALIFATILHHYDHLRSKLSSSTLLFFWLTTIIGTSIHVRSLILAGVTQTLALFSLECIKLSLSLSCITLQAIPKNYHYYQTLDENIVLLIYLECEPREYRQYIFQINFSLDGFPDETWIFKDANN